MSSELAQATQTFMTAETAAFELAQRKAKALMSATVLPKEYTGNLGNTLIALELAERTNSAPLQVMQNLYIVHGKPSWSSKFLIGTFNQCGRFSAIRYEWKGEPGAEDYGCRAVCTELATGEKIQGIWITWKLVKAEKWDAKPGSKWLTMPEKMFQYRAAAWLIDVTAPEIGLGLPTAEDATDIIDVDPSTGAILSNDIESALTGNTVDPVDEHEQETQKHEDTDPPIAIVLESIKDSQNLSDLAEIDELIKHWDKRTTAFKQVHQAIENKRNAISG